jgi:electron transfer flavoprotein alpha subunit
LEASHFNEWVQEDSEVLTFRSCVRVGLTILKSIVCIKQVPQVSELKFDATRKTLIREGVHNEINPFDRRALTYATELKRKYGGEVIVLTMGPPQAKEALIEALAMGADRALHLLDRAFAGSDTLATSRALSLAIERERPFDLILCGKYSVDAETGHVGPEVAQFLELPHASGAINVEFSLPSSKAIIDVETDYGFQQIETHLPFLITTAERLIKPTRASPDEIEAAKSKPYKVITASELSTDLSIFGFMGSPTSVSEIYSIETKRMCELIDGPTVEDKVAQLVEKLRTRGLFTGWKDDQEREIRPPDARATVRNDAFWVVTEFVQGQIRNVTYELLGRGIELADRLGSELCAVVLGNATDQQVQELISHGADKVYLVKDAALSTYSSDAYATALGEAVSKFKPYAVVAASTSFGRDFVPRLAAQLQLGMTSDCIGLEINDQGQLVQLKPAFGGNILAPILSKTRPQLATVRPGMLPPSAANPARKGAIIEVKVSNIKPRAKVIEERFEANRDALRLDNAGVIVAAGAGIGGPENLKIINELAEILDAPIATTRKVVDMGWLPRQLQIGLTGRSVGPKVYFAIGIRGAFNHMVGTGRAKVVVAVNKDPDALIFKSCDYGIVGDYAEVVPALTWRLGEAKHSVTETVLGRA